MRFAKDTACLLCIDRLSNMLVRRKRFYVWYIGANPPPLVIVGMILKLLYNIIVVVTFIVSKTSLQHWNQRSILL